MDLFGEMENSEPELQIIACRNKINKLTEKIRDELQKRREIRTEIDQTKKRRASQVLILERFDEYESVVRKELELAENMQDDDSMKQKVLIEQYENMLKEQKEVWSKYKVEYEDLPLAKELRKIETDVLITNIQLELASYRQNEATRNSNLLNNISKRREQIKIINFAKLWIERRAQEKHCSELSSKIKNLQNKKLELESEVKHLEREVKKVTQEVTKPFTSRIPQIDLSQIVIHKRNNRDDNCDVLSINSYVLEREYMNIDSQTSEPPHNNSTNKNTHQENGQRNDSETLMAELNDPETMTEELDDPESEEMPLYESNKTAHSAQGFKRTGDSGKRVKTNSQESKASSMGNRFYDDAEVSRHNFIKQRIQNNQIQNMQNMQNYMQTTENSTREYEHSHENNKSSQESQTIFSPRKSRFIPKDQRNGQPDQTLKVQQSERNNEQNRRVNPNFQAKKKSSHEFQTNLYTDPYKNQDSMQMNDCNTAKKRGNQQQPNKDSMMANHCPITCNDIDRPVPSPSKMAKRSAQDMALQQQYQPQQQRQQRQQQQQQPQHSPRVNLDTSNESMDLSRLPQSNNKPVVKSCERVHFGNMPMHFRQMELQPKADPGAYVGAPAPRGTVMAMEIGQDGSSMEFEQGIVDSTPMKPSKGNIPPTSMMSTTMMDPTMWGDTVSDILGSEITEPGGSFELAKRIHGDYSDFVSEDEGFDYEKMMGKICSPMVPNDPQPGRFQTNANNQAPTNSNNEVQKSKAEVPNERNFTFGGFAKKPQTSQRLF